MKILKKGLTTAALLVLAATLVACGNGDSGEKVDGSESSKDKTEDVGNIELTVTTWNYETIPEFGELFQAFEAENPGITIKPIDIASDDYDTKLTTMLSSGDTTDILTMKNLLSYSSYALRNQLLDITDHIGSLDTEASQASFDMYKIDGRTYAQPYRTDFWVLYYNKKIFDEAGIEYPSNLTWDEYEELANKLSNPDEQQYGVYQHTWRSITQSIAAAQNDTNLMNPEYDYMEDYYERNLRMQDSKAQMDFGTAKSTKVTYASQFENNQAAMMPMGSWYIASIAGNVAAGTTDVEWGITEMPQKEKGEITTFGSPTAFAINKNSKHQEAAQKFLDFSSSEAGAKVLAKIGVVPAYKTAEIDEIYFSREGMPTDDVSKKAFSPDKIAIEFPVDPNGPTVAQILTEEHDLIMVKDNKPAKGIESMEKRVKSEVE